MILKPLDLPVKKINSIDEVKTPESIRNSIRQSKVVPNLPAVSNHSNRSSNSIKQRSLSFNGDNDIPKSHRSNLSQPPQIPSRNSNISEHQSQVLSNRQSKISEHQSILSHISKISHNNSQQPTQRTNKTEASIRNSNVSQPPPSSQPQSSQSIKPPSTQSIKPPSQSNRISQISQTQKSITQQPTQRTNITQNQSIQSKRQSQLSQQHKSITSQINETVPNSQNPSQILNVKIPQQSLRHSVLKQSMINQQQFYNPYTPQAYNQNMYYPPYPPPPPYQQFSPVHQIPQQFSPVHQQIPYQYQQDNTVYSPINYQNQVPIVSPTHQYINYQPSQPTINTLQIPPINIIIPGLNNTIPEVKEEKIEKEVKEEVNKLSMTTDQVLNLIPTSRTDNTVSSTTLSTSISIIVYKL